MHCADICLSATHNESARKLVMTQFEPCQYRHKSRYASVLQNRCFYTYIWLAYLVRFFERLLRQTTPKLLPLFECLPLLFLLMSLRYSGRPNTTGSFGIRATADASTIPQDLGVTGVFTLTEITQNSNVSSIQPSSIYKYTQGVRYNASLVSSLYKNDLNEVRVNALYGLTLIRAY